jgi:hypothetical protein
MANAAESGVAIGGGDAVSIGGQQKDTVAGRMERALQAVGEDENVEALALGVGAVALSFLLGYAITILSKFPVGIYALGLG